MKHTSKVQRSTDRYTPLQRDRWKTSLAAWVITVLLHVAVWITLPNDLLMQKPSSDVSKAEAIELILEPIVPEKLRYVEANVEAPENEPDQKENYSFRSQQAADETADVSEDDLPRVEGDEASQKIMQGAVDPPEPILSEGGVFKLSGESAESQDTSAEKAVQASGSVLPSAPEFIQQKPEVEDGPGSSLQVPDSGRQIDEVYADSNQPIQLYRAELESRQNADTNDPNSKATEARPLPRKRRTLSPDLVHGPLMRSKGSASRRGAIAIDATFSQFGEYEQQFYAAVQAGWYQEIDFFQPIDTSARVVVEFRIRSDGTIDAVKILNSTAGEVATWVCQLALTKRSPFRPWTREMIEVFGSERVMQIAFSYL